MIDDLDKKKAKDIDDAIFEFLRKKGYSPKRTKKYAKNLNKRLAKKGLALIVKEKYTSLSYEKRCIYLPKFIHIEEIGGKNGNTKDI